MGSTPPNFKPPSDEASARALIFVCDASAEAESLCRTLGDYGYHAVDVPLSLLRGRVSVQVPDVVICDIDAQGCIETVNQVRALLKARELEILFIGDEAHHSEDQIDWVAENGSGFFARPVNVELLREQISEITSASDSRPNATQRPRSLLPPAPGHQLIHEKDSAVARNRKAPPSLLPLPDDADRNSSMAPADVDLAARRVPQAELSKELSQRLKEAEERARDQAVPSSVNSPSSALPALTEQLSEDVLRALAEPLDGEAEESRDAPDASLPEPQSNATGTNSGTNSGTHSGTRTGTNASTHSGTRTGTNSGSRVSAEAPGQIQLPSAVASSQAIPEREEPTTPGRPSDSSELRPPTHNTTAARPSAATGSAAVAQPSSGGQLDATGILPPQTQLTASKAPSPSAPGLNPEATRTTLAPPFTVATRSVGEHTLDTPPASSAEGSRKLVSTTPPKRAPTAPPSAAISEQPVNPAPLTRGDERPLASSYLQQNSKPEAVGGVRAIATAIQDRFTGCIAVEVDLGIRRVLFRDGDFVTASSGVHNESLVGFLVSRGDLKPELAADLGARLPSFGRHAGAALIANGHLSQDQLWSVLRTHAEFIVGQIVAADAGNAKREADVPQRLSAEPGVFGGATGAEVFLEALRRRLPPEPALERIGGLSAMFSAGANMALIEESALSPDERMLVDAVPNQPIDDMVRGEPALAVILYGLLELGVLRRESIAKPKAPEPSKSPEVLDDEAIRNRIRARLALVQNGDYFALLGVPRRATAYDIRRAYSELRRGFEPSLILSAGTADLQSEVDTIVEVLDEAYDILRDQVRRDRYRRAIEATPLS
ncbi:MAG: hypothetical protein HRU17_03930 [Polyangiaceae bacterium]|nr:hypothetical protein [Polyangiaceae bacterium]